MTGRFGYARLLHMSTPSTYKGISLVGIDFTGPVTEVFDEAFWRYENAMLPYDSEEAAEFADEVCSKFLEALRPELVGKV